MTINPIGDNARAYALQNATNRLKSTLDALSSELNSGKVADITQRVRGNLQPLNHIENRMSLLQQFKLNSAEASGQVDAMQAVLGDVHSKVEKMGVTLMAVTVSESPHIVSAYAQESSQAFQSVISQLNTTVAGVAIFSGVDTDRLPLASADSILAELETIVSGATTADEASVLLDDWFSAPAGDGGFLDFAYSGSQGGMRQVQLSERDKAAVEIDASHPVLRDTMKLMAMGALVDRGFLSDSPVEQKEILRLSGMGLFKNTPDVIGLRSNLGLTQQQIESVSAQNASALASYEIARNEMVSADPFATSTALMEVQTQLETLYTLTSRLSNLKLVDYLR
ncbi:MAG: flagellin [Paracoccus sp. (in: a-proteobacteria)]|uniref:flagellin n=1 Tax=Paracoccus sp. TaxID=267 RepID=UPI0026DEE42A|nr:flagellin [Paracoccus sp. (in: a-proteobacteria)]MDO5613767.1 flagellin [Paracoccus sp. (in: a-proteobacteria)]